MYPGIAQGNEDVFEYNIDVWMEICRTVASQLLEDKDTGMTGRFNFVRLYQIDSCLYFVIHETFSKCGSPDLCYLSKGLGSREHKAYFMIWKQVLDIVVKPKEVALCFNRLIRLETKKVIY